MAEGTELPREWYEEHSGQSLVLNSDVVAAELARLRAAPGARDLIAAAIIGSAIDRIPDDVDAIRALAFRAYRIANIVIEERDARGT